MKPRMRETTLAFMADQLKCTPSSISQRDVDLVAEFLIVWAHFEQELFDGYLQVPDLKKYSHDHKLCDDVALASRDFHSIYQDPVRYHNLRKHETVTPLLKLKFEELEDHDKLLLVLYVVYRYRNNIFHGNKGLKSWTQYSDVITTCIDAMIKLIQTHNDPVVDDENGPSQDELSPMCREIPTLDTP